jgi:hypothetical protein
MPAMSHISKKNAPINPHTPSHNTHKNNPKFTTSNNAVGFASTAIPYKTPENTIYFFTLVVSSTLSASSVVDLRNTFKNTNHEYNAKIIRAKTPISVLLSMNTRKAPIPLINH